MDKIEWSENYSVGISKIDEQHKNLINMVNHLIDSSTSDNTAQDASDVLTSMTKYAISHFEYEEQLLTEHEYPDLEDHKELHEGFMIKTVQLHTVTSDQDGARSEKLLEYLRQWWISHILKEDMKYSKFFEEKGLLDKINA